jgi:predicted membrane protein
MLSIIGILLIGAIITFFEIRSFVKKKYLREVIVYFLLLLPGLTFASLLIKGVTIPTPIDLLTKIFSPVTAFVERILS